MTLKDAIRCNIRFVKKDFWPSGWSWELPLDDIEHGFVVAHNPMGQEIKDPVGKMDDQEIDWVEAAH
jgi:hypothetical protein